MVIVSTEKNHNDDDTTWNGKENTRDFPFCTYTPQLMPVLLALFDDDDHECFTGIIPWSLDHPRVQGKYQPLYTWGHWQRQYIHDDCTNDDNDNDNTNRRTKAAATAIGDQKPTKSTPLVSERRLKLFHAGFETSKFIKSWETNFGLLQEYKQEFGHCKYTKVLSHTLCI